jgi:opacity protein-like surface antigen
MKMKDEAIGDSELEPHFSTPYFYLDGVLNFGGFMKPGGMINPYIVAGPGVYMWKVTDDGANGDAILVGEEEFKKTSLGIHFGPGIEIFATPKLSIFAEGKYHIVFTEDEEKFGPEFANMSAIDISAGLTYHFNLGTK